MTERNQGVYKIVNTVNDYFYIGSAVNLKRRKTRHFSELRNQKHNNARLQAAWNKYGESSFTFEVVEYVEDVQLLYDVEDRWLTGHVGKQYCYNIGMAAISPMLGLKGELSPTWGYRHTEEAKEKIAAAGRGRPVSEEARAKRSAKLKGREISLEQRVRISKTLSGEGNYWYGKKRPDHGAKVSKSVAVTDSHGAVTIFQSIQTLRQELDLAPPTVNRALKSGKPIAKGPKAGWSFKYVDPAPTSGV